MNIERGDIFYADLHPVVGSEQDGIRPVLVIQNNIGNKYSPTVIVIPITTKIKSNLPTHIPIKKEITGLSKNSIILVEQLRTIDKRRIIKKIGKVDKTILLKVKEAIKISLSIRGSISNIVIDW